ncbi:hypothetical protein BKI52_01410 [marine bacterium AO1-C]|nr:hypothetical protein BKI52_01410 [marine bacterium AO1-C]
MKTLRFTFLILLCVLGSFATYSQNPYWALYPVQKYNIAGNTMSTMPGATPSGCSNARTNGLFDVNGNPIFYVAGHQVYNRFGQVIHTISPSFQFECGQGLAIVPVPGGGCGAYYILYAGVANINNPSNLWNYDGYEVGAVRISVDASQNASYVGVSKLLFEDLSISISTFIDMAVGKEIHGKRNMYVSFRRSASPLFDTKQIMKISIDNNGLTKQGGYFDGKTNFSMDAKTLELSPNQRYLAWIAPELGNGTSLKLMILDLVTGNIQSNGNLPPLAGNSDIEFGSNSDDIYVTTQWGIVRTSRTYPISYTLIPGSYTYLGNGQYSSIYLGGDIELASNGRFYVASTSGNLAYIVGNTLTANVIAYNGLDLPEQVDGENITYQASSSLNVSISINLNGSLQAIVSGGSGNYSYTWNSPGNPNFSVSSTLTPCGRQTHVLVVRDNSTGCSVSTSLYHSTNRACKAKLPLELLSMRTTNAAVKVGQAKFYPNPAKDFVNVQVAGEEAIQRIQVVNLNGQVLVDEAGSKSMIQRLSINGLKKGIYLINIVTDKSSSQQKLLVK